MNRSNDDIFHLQAQADLIDAVAASLRREGHAVAEFETHLSRILVAGGLAYKFKKAVRYDFVDFSTLEGRRFFCQEEVRLNKRLAPRLYLDVVAVSLDEDGVTLAGQGRPLEYAVRMRAFEQQAIWTGRIAEAGIAESEIDQIAVLLARFHAAAARAPEASDWGKPAQIESTSEENLSTLTSLADGSAERADQHLPLDESQRRFFQEALADLEDWESAQRSALRPAWLERARNGMVRECHGDLHCGNILTTAHGIEVFDCVEFSAELRWIDVMNDLAFLLMDLAFLGAQRVAFRVLNRYLEETGDYGGLQVLHYYVVQRAVVRAKVSMLRAAQGLNDTNGKALRQGLAYLAFARGQVRRARPSLMITHGCSGSGKTTFARNAAASLGAILIRSDVERKRLHGLPANSHAGPPSLYERDATLRTYARLAALARSCLVAGYPVIVDAAFLERWQRSGFLALAGELELPAIMFDMSTDAETMRGRLRERARRGNDASDAGIEVLDRQLAHAEPVDASEAFRRIAVDTNGRNPAAAIEEAYATAVP
ncbi:bifunctional aminoglycoside phosphotransferase/ATP-binding protein [Noviherbaspirillum galbum]|uniref:AAA family ATPase n=1 Tax=Noviherbaspirillum galbum TaxID=2709383 RepID=A0A6B3STY6_9BURK|nr:bifunctional aminoglycoside phosphotransferase/ATP-binding protein [Noviherbaspirillum galbum]NEX62336.1 AAA family ATPase [Noviherbaspirillum galbum]